MVALMLPALIALSVWQYHRHQWKTALLAELAARDRLPLIVLPARVDAALAWRRVHTRCAPDPLARWRSVQAGQSLQGVAGFQYERLCPRGAGSTTLTLVAGWAQRFDVAAPRQADMVNGRLVDRYPGRAPPDALTPRYVLYADAPLAGLTPAQPPTIKTIPNNHLSYAVQWLSFALVLLAIYGLYLRRRGSG